MKKTDRLHILADIDNLQFRLSCGIGMIASIHTAMEEGGTEASSHLDAIFGAYDYLHSLNDELRECVDALFKGRENAA